MTLGDIGLAVNQMQEPLVYIKPLPEPVSELTFDEQAHWPLPPRLDPESEFLFAVRVRSLGACPDVAAGFVGLWGQTAHLALVRANSRNPSQHTARGAIGTEPHVAAECRQLAHDRPGFSPSQTRFLRLQGFGWRLV